MALIKCPKCGKDFSDRAQACPHCGISQEEVARLIAEKEAAEAAECERLRQERLVKEAEEERIRAEKRAEWWAANKRKVGIAILILIGIIVSIVAVKKISDAIAAKHAVTEAYEMIEQGKELVSTYHFDEAKDLYEQAYRMTMDNEVRKAVQEQNDELVKARQAAESEYNNALRRLQILLDADDNEFNQYSNECLDKMIAIHPEANTTQYFQNTFANHSLLTSIQNYEKQGNELYKQGQYEKAAKKYKAAIVVFEMEDKTPSAQLIQKKETAQQCATLLKKATTAEVNNQYPEAATAYSELYTLHALVAYNQKSQTYKSKKKKNELIDLVIPNGTKEIKYRAYDERNDIRTVSIPNSVTSIGTNAFSDCKNLTSISIPNSVTRIGSGAFNYCTSLTSIHIPNSVKSIETNAFSGVANVVYSGTATGGPWGARCFNGYVEGYMVYRDKSKKELLACSSAITGDVVIPQGVTSIGEEAFVDCKGITSITIPNSVASIKSSAFEGCTSLTSVTIPNSVTSIGSLAFYNCTNLLSITIPNSVTSIGRDAFNNYYRSRKLNIKLPKKFKDKVDLSNCKSVTYY